MFYSYRDFNSYNNAYYIIARSETRWLEAPYAICFEPGSMVRLGSVDMSVLSRFAHFSSRWD
jgi:hypothetical protein